MVKINAAAAAAAFDVDELDDRDDRQKRRRRCRRCCKNFATGEMQPRFACCRMEMQLMSATIARRHRRRASTCVTAAARQLH